MSELIAETDEDYVAIAARVARDPSLWARMHLAATRVDEGEFFDDAAYSAKFARAVRSLAEPQPGDMR